MKRLEKYCGGLLLIKMSVKGILLNCETVSLFCRVEGSICESECSNGKKTANNILKQKITHVVGSFLIVRGDLGTTGTGDSDMDVAGIGDLGTTGTGDSDMDVAGIGDSDICFVMVVCVYCCWYLCLWVCKQSN